LALQGCQNFAPAARIDIDWKPSTASHSKSRPSEKSKTRQTFCVAPAQSTCASTSHNGTVGAGEARGPERESWTNPGVALIVRTLVCLHGDWWISPKWTLNISKSKIL
jgi:hypothetical protein